MKSAKIKQLERLLSELPRSTGFASNKSYVKKLGPDEYGIGQPGQVMMTGTYEDMLSMINFFKNQNTQKDA